MDAGATCSFISHDFVKEQQLPIVKCHGLIQQAMTGYECERIGEVQGVEVRNGSKTIFCNIGDWSIVR